MFDYNVSLTNTGFRYWTPESYCMSVQWGAMHYCDNRGSDYTAQGIDLKPSKTVEVAFIDDEGVLLDLGSDSVLPYVPVYALPKLMNLFVRFVRRTIDYKEFIRLLDEMEDAWSTREECLKADDTFKLEKGDEQC